MEDGVRINGFVTRGAGSADEIWFSYRIFIHRLDRLYTLREAIWKLFFAQGAQSTRPCLPAVPAAMTGLGLV